MIRQSAEGISEGTEVLRPLHLGTLSKMTLIMSFQFILGNYRLLTIVKQTVLLGKSKLFISLSSFSNGVYAVGQVSEVLIFEFFAMFLHFLLIGILVFSILVF